MGVEIAVLLPHLRARRSREREERRSAPTRAPGSTLREMYERIDEHVAEL